MRVIDNPDQDFLASITGSTELAWNEQLVYHPPTFQCPEEGSYDIQLLREFNLESQIQTHMILEGQSWVLNELGDLLFGKDE